MIRATVKSIGKDALNPKDDMIILFGEKATEELRKVSIIQEISDERIFELKEGHKIFFDEKEYEIKKVGRLANEHLSQLGHVSIFFKEVPEDETLGNVLYVEPFDVPYIKEGTIIVYQ